MKRVRKVKRRIKIERKVPRLKGIRIRRIYLLAIFILIGLIAFSIYTYIQFYQRPSYCDGLPYLSNCLPYYPVFSHIPMMPKDFWVFYYLIKAGRLDFSDVDERYWKQPEFYGDTFTRPGGGAEMMREYIASKGVLCRIAPNGTEICGPVWYFMGYGTYPAEAGVTMRAGMTDTLLTFFYTSFNVYAWQGMQLYVDYPASITTVLEMDGKKSFEQDPEVTKQYFDIEVNPKILLLEPAVPHFYYNWTQRVEIKVHAKENTPPGYYVIGIYITSPPEELNHQWTLEYYGYYQPVGGVALGRPQFTIVVEIVE
jgi:hypothetical protein